MKKHLFGFALFSLIIGTAVFISPMMRQSPSPAKSYTYEVSNRSCWKNTRQNSEIQQSYYGPASIKITQAVLNEKTRKLDTSFSIQRETPSTQNVKVKLTFVNGVSKYNENFDGVVRTEFVDLSPNFNVNNSGTLSMIFSYQWLDDLKDSQNLYIRAEVVDNFQKSFENSVSRKTNFNEFTPVLLINKNRNF